MRRVFAPLVCLALALSWQGFSHAENVRQPATMWVGLTAQDLNADFAGYFKVSQGEGVLVSSVMNPGPAAKAGIKPGDIVQQFDGKKVASVKELASLVAGAQEDSPVKVSVLRGRKHLVFEVKVTDRPSDIHWRGMTVSRSHTPLMISGVDPGSDAQACGLIASDVLLEVDGVKIDFPDDFTSNTASRKGPVLIRTARGYFLVKDGH